MDYKKELMYEASQIDCSKDSVTNMKILFEMCPFSLTKTSAITAMYYFMFAMSFSHQDLLEKEL